MLQTMLRACTPKAWTIAGSVGGNDDTGFTNNGSFNLGGYVHEVQGNDSWDLNPGNHDATSISDSLPTPIPVLDSLVIAAPGTSLVGWIHMPRAL